MAIETSADDREVLRMAALAIATLGDQAWVRCAKQVCQFLERDDLQAAHECRLVLTAIAELQDFRRPDDVTCH